MRPARLVHALALAATLVVGACATDVHEPSCSTPVTFTDVSTKVFSIPGGAPFQNCAFSTCHDATTHANALDLTQDQYDALVGATPYNVPARQQGMKRVTAGDDWTSFLVVKLRLTEAVDPFYGERMPNGQNLPTDQIDMVRCWIRAGAPNN